MSTSFSSAPHTAPRTALVTGAGKRLGREIALGLAQAGWHVAVHYKSSEAEALQTAKDCLALNEATASWDPHRFIFQADLGDESATRHLLAQVVRQLGDVHGVVNSAALFEHDDIHSFSYANMAQHWGTSKRSKSSLFSYDQILKMDQFIGICPVGRCMLPPMGLLCRC